ncbi:AMP-activated protein kinase glycogen-binding domain, partial [Trinorchestia longiramus]
MKLYEHPSPSLPYRNEGLEPIPLHSGRSMRRVPGLNSACDIISVNREPPDKSLSRTTSPRQVHPLDQTQLVSYDSKDRCNGCPVSTDSTSPALDPNSNSKPGPERCIKNNVHSPLKHDQTDGYTNGAAHDFASTGYPAMGARELVSHIGYLSTGRGYPTTPNLVMKHGKVEILGQGAPENNYGYEMQKNLLNILPPNNVHQKKSQDPLIAPEVQDEMKVSSTSDQLKTDHSSFDIPSLSSTTEAAVHNNSDVKHISSTSSNSSNTLPSIVCRHPARQPYLKHANNKSSFSNDSQAIPVKMKRPVLRKEGRDQQRRAAGDSLSSDSSEDCGEETDDTADHRRPNTHYAGKMPTKRRAPQPPGASRHNTSNGRTMPAQRQRGVLKTTNSSPRRLGNGTSSRSSCSRGKGRCDDDGSDEPLMRSPAYYENYSQMMQIISLNVENKKQHQQLSAVSRINQELLADLKAQHDSFASSLDTIMESLVAGIINKEQLRSMVTDLQKKMARLKAKNDALQKCTTDPRYSSLPHSHPPVSCGATSTGSLPHIQHRHDKLSRSYKGPNSDLPAPQESCEQPTGGLNFKISERTLQFECTELPKRSKDIKSCGQLLRTSASLPQLNSLYLRLSSTAARGDEGYWTMGSQVPGTDSRSTLPRASKGHFHSSHSPQVVPCPPLKVPDASALLNLSLVRNVHECKTQPSNLSKPMAPLTSVNASISGSAKWSTVPRFSSACASKNVLPPSRTHQSICLSGSKYLSPMACDGLERIITDIIKDIYVKLVPETSTSNNQKMFQRNKFPICLSFVGSPEEAMKGLARGVYHLNFMPCGNSKCSVCSDMITRGSSTFEVFWPCPEGRRLQLIHMTRTGGRDSNISTVKDSESADTSTCSQGSETSTTTLVPSLPCSKSATLMDASRFKSRMNGPLIGSRVHGKSTMSFTAESEASGSVVPPGYDPDFVVPEMEWCGGSFQNPDKYWREVNEFLPTVGVSRESPRSGCSDQLAMYPNDLSCGSLRGNISSNSSRITDLDYLSDRLSDRFLDFRTGSCPDLTSDGCSDLLMPEGDMASLESCSEGDLMSLDSRFAQSSRAYYSIVEVDVDMFSPTQQQGVLPSLQSLCYGAGSVVPHESPPPASPLPPHPELSESISCSESCDDFPDPPFPDPPVNHVLNHDGLPHEQMVHPITDQVTHGVSGERLDYVDGRYAVTSSSGTREVQSVSQTCDEIASSAIPDGHNPLRLSPPTPGPVIPPHFIPVDSPSIPKRVTSRPLPSLPPPGEDENISVVHQQFSPQVSCQLADYTIAEHIESPCRSPSPPVLPVRGAPTHASRLVNGNRTLPQACGLTTSVTRSPTLSHCSPALPPSLIPNLPHILPGMATPPRAPCRSSSLLGSRSRPVSSVDYQYHIQQQLQFTSDANDNSSDGGKLYSSNSSSPQEGLESSWVRLNSDAFNNSPTTALGSPGSGEDSASLPTGTSTRRTKKTKKGRHQGNCISGIQCEESIDHLFFPALSTLQNLPLGGILLDLKLVLSETFCESGMGNHHSSHGPERRPRDYGPSNATPPRLDEPPINIDNKSGRAVGGAGGRFKPQVSEDDTEPIFKDLKSPDPKDEPVRFRPLDNNRKMLPFVIKWPGGGQNVNLSGAFNNWQKLPMVKSEKDFVAIIDLPEGDFEYKFEVDGEWKINPNEEKITNKEGIENNLIKIKDTDFEELENHLLKDPNDLNQPDPFEFTHNLHAKHDDPENDGYGQSVPEHKPTEKVKDPPVLPPHLLQVILNKDTPVS